jgi:hypothetical protein
MRSQWLRAWWLWKQTPFTHVSESEPEPEDELEEAEFERDRGMVLQAGNVHSAALSKIWYSHSPNTPISVEQTIQNTTGKNSLYSP